MTMAVVAPSHDDLRQLVDIVAAKCAYAGVNFAYDDIDKRPHAGIPCVGWFDREAKELFVAAKNDVTDVYTTLLHESCHLQQFIDDELHYIELENGCDAFFNWLAHDIELQDDELQHAVQLIVELEADCERRALSMITNCSLPVDAATYGKMGSAYAHFPRAAARRRKWYRLGRSPYGMPSIWRSFPSTPDPLWLPEEKHYTLYERCFGPIPRVKK